MLCQDEEPAATVYEPELQLQQARNGNREGTLSACALKHSRGKALSCACSPRLRGDFGAAATVEIAGHASPTHQTWWGYFEVDLILW